MNLAQGEYTHERVLEALFSNERKIHYEYSVQDNTGKYLGSLSACEGRVSFDSSSSIMRTFSGSAMKTEILDINLIDEKIVPWFCIEIDGDVLKYPLGKFVISPTFSLNGPEKNVTINGYDLGKIALDDKVSSRVVKNKDNFYTNELQEILSELYPMCSVETSEQKRVGAYEWSPGTSKLDIVNDILTSLNYYPLHFDEYGIPIGKPYVFPESQPVDMYYQMGKRSIILPNSNLSSNRFYIPNKIVRYIENVDSEYLISSYVNEDPDNKFSTVSRGRTIVDVKSISDIASQQDLDNYVKRCAVTAMAVTDEITFKTMNMPGHGFKNCLFVEVDDLGIRGKVIEVGWEMDLKVGGEMIHKCTKVVNVL